MKNKKIFLIGRFSVQNVHCPTQCQVPPVLNSTFKFRTLTPNVHILYYFYFLRPSTATSMTSAKTISEKPSSPLPETSEVEDDVILTEEPENTEQPNDPVEDEVENEMPPEASDDTPEADPEPSEETADADEDNPADAEE